MDLGCKGLEKSVLKSVMMHVVCYISMYLSVKLRISMGSSSNESGAASCGVVDSSSSFFANTSPSAASSSSGSMFALRGSSMSVTRGPCSVLARLRDSGLLGADSSRVKDREGCRFLGRAAILECTDTGLAACVLSVSCAWIELGCY